MTRTDIPATVKAARQLQIEHAHQMVRIIELETALQLTIATLERVCAGQPAKLESIRGTLDVAHTAIHMAETQ